MLPNEYQSNHNLCTTPVSGLNLGTFLWFLLLKKSNFFPTSSSKGTGRPVLGTCTERLLLPCFVQPLAHIKGQVGALEEFSVADTLKRG